MIYYKIDELNEEKAIGCKWPQANVRIPLDLQDAIFYQKSSKPLPAGIDKRINVFLKPDALKTDFISNAELTWGFLISKDVKKVLKSFNLGDSFFIPINLKQADLTINNYELFFVKNSIREKINFKCSKFIYASYLRPTKDAQHIEVNSFEDIKKLNNQNKKKKVYMVELAIEVDEGKKAIDIFTIPGQSFVFISEQIKKELEHNNLTGYKSFESQMPRIFLM